MSKTVKLLSAAVAVLFFLLLNQCGDTNFAKTQHAAMQDSVVHYVDKYNRSVADKQAIQVDHAEDILQYQDSIDHLMRGMELLSLVKNKVVTVTKEVYPTVTTYDHPEDSCPEPTYTATYTDKWKSQTIVATGESIYVNQTLYNEFTYLIGYNSKWFTTDITVRGVSANPETTTLSMDAYVVRPELPRLTHGPSVGVGMDVITKKPIAYAGYGITVNLNRKQKKRITWSRGQRKANKNARKDTDTQE